MTFSKESPFSEGRLLKIPRVRPKTVAAFIGEVGDVARFKQAKELIGFIGFHPTISESGKRKNQHPKMSRKGSPTLRVAFLSVWVKNWPVLCPVCSKTESPMIPKGSLPKLDKEQNLDLRIIGLDIYSTSFL